VLRRFVLIATVSREELASAEFDRFLESLGDQAVRLDLHVAIRGRRCDERVTLKPAWNGGVFIYDAPPRTSLAEARNLVLRSLLGLLNEDDIVAFPDDDCWYPEGLLKAVAREIAAWDAVTGTYSPDPPRLDAARFSPDPVELDWRAAYERTASVTQFYRGTVVRDVGLFDERFGVGATFLSGEDADYLVRAVDSGWRCFYQPSLTVGHRAIGPRLNLHFVGGVVLLAKHARGTRLARRLLVRRLLSGARTVLRGQLSIRAYSRTLAGVASVLVSR
jgi:hypothetical protein